MGRFPLFWMGVAALAGMTSVGCGGSEPRAGGGGSGGDGADDKTSSTGGESTCVSIAARDCAQIETCLPEIFGALYTGLADCKAEGAAACAEAELGGATGFVDPHGCKAASLSCDDYFGSEACAWKPGTKIAGESCTSNKQCGAGLYCDDTDCGHCVAAAGVGESCDTDPYGHQCDYRRTDVACVGTLSDPMDQRCRTMSFGAAGASCARRTELGCAAGLVCAGGSCVAALPRGAACDSSMDKCAYPWLSCIDEGGSTVCGSFYRLAELGEECGFSTTPTLCRAGAYCDYDLSRCMPERAKGAACEEQVNSCARGLQCKDGTCQDEDPITCD